MYQAQNNNCNKLNKLKPSYVDILAPTRYSTSFVKSVVSTRLKLYHICQLRHLLHVILCH